MKNLALAGLALVASGAAALAADLPARRAPPPPVAIAPVFTWTGFYAGTTTGYVFTDKQAINTRGNNDATGGLSNTILNVAQFRRPPSIGSSTTGVTSISGGIGYDYQFGVGTGIVVGIAADAGIMGLDRRRGYVSPAQPSNGFVPEISGFRQQLDWMGTVRGRVGYAFDRLLIYGTGGFAYGGVDYRAAFLRNTDGALVYAGRANGIATGYVYGGGIEYAIPTDSFLTKFSLLNYLGVQSQAVTLKAEYLRYDLGHYNLLVPAVLPGGPTGSYTSRFQTEGSVVRAGLTYRFGDLF